MNFSTILAKITFAHRDTSHFEPRPDRDWLIFLITFLIFFIIIVAGHSYFYYSLTNGVVAASSAAPAVVNDKKLTIAIDYLHKKSTAASQPTTAITDPSL